MKHSTIQNKKVIEKVISRRGRLHAFQQIEPASTALIIIDMTVAFVEGNAECTAIIPAINELADRLRHAGGTVSWVIPRSDAVQKNHIAVFGTELAEQLHKITQPAHSGSKLFPTLETAHADITAYKLGYSAFFPGKSDLHEQLQKRNIETVIICGTVTNVCCESSARDAVELGYQTILAADLNVGHTHGLHEAALTTFYRSFGDVRTYKELIELLR